MNYSMDGFVYLLSLLPILLLWSVIFRIRPDERNEMLVVGIFLGVVSVVSSYIWWTNDWWRPETITGTRVGIEDFILGFCGGGFMAVIYEIVMKKRRYRFRGKPDHPNLLALFAIWTAIIVVLINIFEFTSFVASSIAFVVATGIMLWRRRDLIVNSMFSGIATASSAFLFGYLPIIALAPEWVQNTYLYNNLSGITLIQIPIEEYVFWLLAGFLVGPSYEYWQHQRLRKLRTNFHMRRRP